MIYQVVVWCCNYRLVKAVVSWQVITAFFINVD